MGYTRADRLRICHLVVLVEAQVHHGVIETRRVAHIREQSTRAIPNRRFDVAALHKDRAQRHRGELVPLCLLGEEESRGGSSERETKG